MAALQGSCGCGAVRFEVAEPFVSASYCHCTRFGLASRSLDEVIDFYPSPEAAGRGLQDALADEPEWRDDLCVVAIELPDPAARLATPGSQARR